MFSVRRIAITTFMLLGCAGVAHSQNLPPKTTGAIPAATLYSAARADVVDLSKYFTDPDTTEVRLTTPLGNIDLDLYDNATPITVANFLKYVDNGRYEIKDPTNGQPAPIFFHRSVPGFVIQTGGFLATVNPTNPSVAQPTQVMEYPAIKNEPGISNTRGTVAMAKLGTDPNSATSQFFINLADNSANLDNQDGGFTVFARVAGDGMSVADAIAALPTFNFGGAFTDLPLRSYTSGAPTTANLVTSPVTRIPLNSAGIAAALTFTATSSHPAAAAVAISADHLLITPKAVGTADITVTATDIDGGTVSQTFSVNVIINPAHLGNISTRVLVGTSQDNPLIGGFIIASSTTAKRVAIRALGPSLANAPYNLSNVLADPTLQLIDSKNNVLATNDNWQSAANKQEIIDAQLAPKNPKESVILTTLPASDDGIGYTAVIRGADGGGGIGLVEVYDLDSGPGSSLGNISTRGDVEGGNDVMIGGLIVSGQGAQRLLVRAIGPSLTAYGVANALSDPTLTLYDSQGTQVDFNDDWQKNPSASKIKSTNLAPSDPRESAILQSLMPGAYTAIVRGKGGATGTGLVEAYALPTNSF
ncbi:MAG TPA: peptidylprolyl isomerase [Chthoniobacterales bacterium]|nr:peptidylprolyl isomerase [Chthoniobacterales bacterium]